MTMCSKSMHPSMGVHRVVRYYTGIVTSNVCICIAERIGTSLRRNKHVYQRHPAPDVCNLDPVVTQPFLALHP